MTRWSFILIVILAASTVTHAQVYCDSKDSYSWRHQQPFGLQQSQQTGLIPTPNGGALFEPITTNAYGPGLNSDATGRPFIWTPQGSISTIPDPTLQVKPNAYGPGIGMDQYGRPIQPACQPGWAGPC